MQQCVDLSGVNVCNTADLVSLCVEMCYVAIIQRLRGLSSHKSVCTNTESCPQERISVLNVTRCCGLTTSILSYMHGRLRAPCWFTFTRNCVFSVKHVSSSLKSSAISVRLGGMKTTSCFCFPK